MIGLQGGNKLVAPLHSCHSNIFTYHKNGMLAAFGVNNAQIVLLYGEISIFFSEIIFILSDVAQPLQRFLN